MRSNRIAIILFMTLFVLLAQTAPADSNKEEILENLGFKLGEEESPDPEDIEIVDEDSLRIKDSAKGKTIDVSGIEKRKYVIVNTEVVIKDSSGNEYHLTGKNEFSIEEGMVVHSDLEMEKYIRIDDDTKMEYISENGKSFILENGFFFNSNDGSVAVYIDKKFFGRLIGRANLYNIKDSRLILLPVSEKDGHSKSFFFDSKGNLFENFGRESMKLSLKENLRIDGGSSEEGRYNVEIKDGSYENLIIDPLGGKLEIGILRDDKTKEKTVLNLGDSVKLRGSLHGLESGVSYLIKNSEGPGYYPWVFKGDEVLGKNSLGLIDNKDPLEVLEQMEEGSEIRQLLLKQIAGADNFLANNLVGSLESHFPEDKKVSRELFEGLLARDPDLRLDPLLRNSLFKLAENDPVSQKILIGKFHDTIDLREVVKGVGGRDIFRKFDDVENYLVEEKIDALGREDSDSYFENSEGRLLLEIIKGNSKESDLKDVIAQKTDGLLEAEIFESMSASEKQKVLSKTSFYSGESFSEALKSIGANKELKRKALSRMHSGFEKSDNLIDALIETKSDPMIQQKLLSMYESPENPSYRDRSPITIHSEWGTIRKAVKNLEPETLLDVFQLAEEGLIQQNLDPGFDIKKMSNVYSMESFKEITKEMTPLDRWDYGLTASRYLDRRNKELTETNLIEGIEKIKGLREKNLDRVILGPDHKFLPITHDERISERSHYTYSPDSGEPMFRDEKMVMFAKDSGVTEENIFKGLKGPSAKGSALDHIESSEGPTTIHFSGHGGPNHLWLSSGQVGKERSDNLETEKAISYKELGDALIQRSKNGGSLKNLNILVDSCFSYDFGQKLYSYLGEEGKDVIESLPSIMTSTNRGQYSIIFPPHSSYARDESWSGSPYLDGLHKTKPSQGPLRLKDVYGAQEHSFEWEDSAIFIPEGRKVLPTGSSVDEVRSSDKLPDKQDSDKDKPSFIEVSQITFDRNYFS